MILQVVSGHLPEILFKGIRALAGQTLNPIVQEVVDFEEGGERGVQGYRA